MTRVLVVDDSQETCDLLELLLADSQAGTDLEVIKATRPEEAVRHLEAGGVDLMLSDINLEASMDGLDLLRLAKPLGVETILLTGFGTLSGPWRRCGRAPSTSSPNRGTTRSSSPW